MNLRCETETSVISLKLFVLLCNAPVVIYSYIRDFNVFKCYFGFK